MQITGLLEGWKTKIALLGGFLVAFGTWLSTGDLGDIPGLVSAVWPFLMAFGFYDMIKRMLA